MKKSLFCWLFAFLFLSVSHAQYRAERTGYEGDYFSLEGALELFKQSGTLRDFERQINTEENWVNNLDLNYDGRIDYIRVEHRQQGNFHAIILQALVDRYAVQDVAVIEIEIIGRREAILQIVGDEDLYGEEVFVEPVEGYADSRSGYNPEYGSYVNVYYWRPIQYMLGRQYHVYVSPYRWRYYPVWWNPWAQFSWNVFRPRIVIYFEYYHIVQRPRLIQVHHFYRPYRSYCYTVVRRANRVRISQGRSPVYRPVPTGQPGRRPGSYRARNEVAERQRAAPSPRTSRQSPSLSRKGSPYTTEQGDIRSRTSRTTQRPGITSAPRSTDQPRASGQSSSVSRKRTPSASERSDVRSRTQRATPKPRSSAGSKSTPRSIDQPRTSRQKPSVSGKSTPSYQQNRSSSSSRSQVRRSSPAPAKRPQASSRSQTPDRKPSVSRSRTGTDAKVKGSRSNPSKRSSSKSRRGGGV